MYSSHSHSHCWHVCVPIPMKFPWESYGDGNPIPMHISSAVTLYTRILLIKLSELFTARRSYAMDLSPLNVAQPHRETYWSRIRR